MSKLGRSAVVVTGASSGIGAATALACARRGASLLLVARRSDRLHAVAEACRAAGARVEALVLDIAEPGASERIFDLGIDRFGSVDIVLANAGYGVRRGLLDMEEAELRAMFEVNFFAALTLCSVAARSWRAADRPGHIIMCSSCIGKFPLAYHGAYCATKASQAMACAALRAELLPHRIAVSSVHPITTRTEFFEAAARAAGRIEASPAIPDHAPSFLVQSPERVAAAIVRCMERPVPEVWTSSLVRFSAGLFTAWPWLLHQVLERQAGTERDQDERRLRADSAEP